MSTAAIGAALLAVAATCTVIFLLAILRPDPGHHAHPRREQREQRREQRRRKDPAALWLRWKLWALLIRSRRVCPVNAHGALIWRTRPWREMFVDRNCRIDAAENGACFCGNIRDTSLRPAVRPVTEEESPAPEPLPGRDLLPEPGEYPRHEGVILTGPLGTITITPSAGLNPYPLDTQTRPQAAARDEMEPISPARGYAPQNTPEMIP
jgi:hypothetical protein